MECDVKMEAGQAVSLNHVIVENILNALSWRDLERCAEVCTTWSDCCDRLLRTGAPAQGVCFYKSGPSRALNSRMHMESSKVKPLLALVFSRLSMASCTLPCEQLPGPDCGQDCPKHNVVQYLQNMFCNKEALKIGIVSSLVFHAVNQNQIFGKEAMLSGIFLPKIPNVNVHNFDIRLQNKREFIDQSLDDTLDKITNISNKEAIKCMLFFVTNKALFDEMENYVVRTIQTALQYSTQNIAIGGGNVIKYSIDGANMEDKQVDKFTVVILTTPLNDEPKTEFDVHSTVLFQTQHTESQIIARIDNMSKSIPRRKYSAALKFTCFKRANINALEATTFKKYFPDTFMSGCELMGEIGMNFQEHYPDKVKLEPPAKVPRITQQFPLDRAVIFHCYSTVFVVFSWGSLL